VRTPILGIEKYFDASIGKLGLKNVQAWSAPQGSASQSTTHGGFDDDVATRTSIISLIKTGKLPT
jgi:hypothetical protein